MKKTLNVEQLILGISRSYMFTLNTLEQTKLSEYRACLRLKKVCPVYNTYPITELKMHCLKIEQKKPCMVL